MARAKPLTPAQFHVKVHSLLDSPWAFIRWLERQNPRKHIGYRASACDCPLATFLKSRGLRPSLGQLHVRPADAANDQALLLPIWASEFIAAVDRGKNRSPVPAHEALRLARTFQSMYRPTANESSKAKKTG